MVAVKLSKHVSPTPGLGLNGFQIWQSPFCVSGLARACQEPCEVIASRHGLIYIFMFFFFSSYHSSNTGILYNCGTNTNVFSSQTSNDIIIDISFSTTQLPLCHAHHRNLHHCFDILAAYKCVMLQDVLRTSYNA